MKNKKETPLTVQETQGKVATSDEEKIEIITEYYRKILSPDAKKGKYKQYEPRTMGKYKQYEQRTMRDQFTQKEITKAIKSLKNGKSAGMDATYV